MGKKDSSKDTKRCSKRMSKVSLLKPKAAVGSHEILDKFHGSLI